MEDAGEPVILAIDPGHEKCGLALMSRSGEILTKEIVPRANLLARIEELFISYDIGTLVLGDRTGSKALAGELERALAGWPRRGAGDAKRVIMFVDEHLSSMEARRRYLLDHPLPGLGRLIPVSLRVPGEPYDDYVAVILGERFLSWGGRPLLRPSS